MPLQVEQCPMDRSQCRYAACELGCTRLRENDNFHFTAEAGQIGMGLAWLGFWIGVGLVVSAIFSVMKL